MNILKFIKLYSILIFIFFFVTYFDNIAYSNGYEQIFFGDKFKVSIEIPRYWKRNIYNDYIEISNQNNIIRIYSLYDIYGTKEGFLQKLFQSVNNMQGYNVINVTYEEVSPTVVGYICDLVSVDKTKVYHTVIVSTEHLPHQFVGFLIFGPFTEESQRILRSALTYQIQQQNNQQYNVQNNRTLPNQYNNQYINQQNNQYNNQYNNQNVNRNTKKQNNQNANTQKNRQECMKLVKNDISEDEYLLTISEVNKNLTLGDFLCLARKSNLFTKIKLTKKSDYNYVINFETQTGYMKFNFEKNTENNNSILRIGTVDNNGTINPPIARGLSEVQLHMFISQLTATAGAYDILNESMRKYSR